MYIVYQHQNLINGKRYFGITSQNPERRWGKGGNGYKSTPHFYSAIQKYGWDNFSHTILYTELTQEQACEIEKYLIATYKTQDRQYGYNILEGGQATTIPSEIRDKMSKAMRGNKNGLGHPCSEEKKQKISKAQKGRKLTEDHKKKLSEAAKKRHVPCTQDKKEKLSKSYTNKKPVYCVETNIVYESVQACARELSLYATNVTKVCKGIHKTTGGYHLKYYDSMINA